MKGVPFGNRSEAILKGTFKKMIHKKGDGLDLGAELPRIKRIESPLSDRQRATCSYRRNEEVSRKDTFVRFNVSPVMLGVGDTKRPPYQIYSCMVDQISSNTALSYYN